MSTCSRRAALLVCACALGFAGTTARAAGLHVPPFRATSLTGRPITRSDLLGAPTVLIVTPGRGAADSTRVWVDRLRANIDLGGVRVRDLLVVDLPFFADDHDAIEEARKQIPAQYHDQTWIMSSKQLQRALQVRSSTQASIFVLNAKAQVMAHVSGPPNAHRLGVIRAALAKLR